jgi:hypothetical protein
MPKDKNPIEELKRILVGMGKTGEDVASCLRADNCRGFKLGTGGFPTPLIRYLYRRFDDGVLQLGSFPHRIGWGTLILHRIDGSHERIALPIAVAEFLELFQEGEFPDLELKDRSTQ